MRNLGAVNTRADLNPANDPLANPNFPGTPPWNPPNSAAWTSVTDYCGSVFAAQLGASGTLLQYGGAGHSAINALCWIGFDVATLTWRRFGPRPLPTNGLYGYRTGITPDPAAFDHAWGDWDGGWTGFPATFRQPGVRVPEGGHTRNSFVYRPAAASGNRSGQVVIGWHATGVNSGTGVPTQHTWDADTGAWSRHANRRPNFGSSVGALVYHEALDVVTGACVEFTSGATAIDVFDCRSRAWARRVMNSGGRSHRIDATGFSWRDANGVSWHVVCQHWGELWPPMQFYAVSADDLAANRPTPWLDLNVTAGSYPADRNRLSFTVSWARCPVDGCYYAVNREHGSRLLWRLVPPSSGELRGAWVITAEVLSGEALDGRRSNGTGSTAFDYSRLQWAPALSAFLWTSDFVGADVQAIRPGGI